MKHILKTVLLLLLVAPLTYGAVVNKSLSRGSNKVLISTQQSLSVGTNKLKVKITKSGKAIQNAKVVLRAFMPAMPGMPAMESKQIASSLGNGEYSADLQLAMSGTWQLHIFVYPQNAKKYRFKTILNF